ncbi:MAG TPA: enoyl-CoA hydratase-related protein [Beijerinckiaceae bacterium]|nr:enoyl-CoA hydratase-related protein [Beijerinckiaceae bacterium]
MTTTHLDIGAHGIATLSLNRPERGNAFNQAMLDELGQAFLDLQEDARVRVVVLRGNGKHFCTGADIASRGDGKQDGLSFNEVLSRIDRFRKPSIAIVQGGCVGGGLGIAACCDVLLAEETAFFSVPELRVGITPSAELSGLLIRAMGYRAFRRYGLSGERISAQDALRIGLAHQVVAPGTTDDEVGRIADAFLQNAPGAQAELKASIADLAWPRPDVLFPPGGPKRRDHARSAEAEEGIAAFREKRKPSWYPKPGG